MIGRTLGHYKVLSKLGSGGMGQVFAAEDTKLLRNVALKLLHEEMTSSAARLIRFEREARAVAAFNHPNIVTIYSVEEVEGLHFIVMELVQGKRLSEMIPRAGMALAKFFEIAIPIASAVSAAHEQAITHRDLKPDNLMVTDEGQVKVLDFGLAKPREEIPPPGEGSELPTEHLTEEGAVLGTVAYMSPEQAEGKSVDHRSDIFSLGIVFYEMLVGRGPFHGETPASVVAAILRDSPVSVTSINPSLPRELSRIVKRCLVKDPDRRYQTAKDLRNDLEDLKQELDSGEALEAGVTGVGDSAVKKNFVLAGAAAVLLCITIIFLLMQTAWKEEKASSVPVQGTFRQVTLEEGQELNPSLSSDGNLVVYQSRASGNWDIYQQRVGGERGFNLTEDSTTDDTQPAFSPDGESIAFRSERDGGGIFLMGATGESVRRLTDFGFNPSWSPDSQGIALATEGVYDPLSRGGNSQVWVVAVANGEKRLLAEGDAVQPSFSPHGQRIAYWGVSGGQRDLWTVGTNGGDPVPVTKDIDVDWNPVWSPDGLYLYFSSDRGGSMNLWRVPIQEASGEVLGEPEPVTTPSSHVSGISMARNSFRVAYASEASTSHLWRIGFDPDREIVEGRPLPITRGSRMVGEHDVSPDGEWLVAGSYGRQESIFVLRTDGTGFRQLTDDRYRNRIPRWSPDGKQIAFFSNRTGNYDVWILHPDGSGLRQLSGDPDRELSFPVWSPDGSQLACVDGSDTVLVLDPRKPPREQSPETLPGFQRGGDSFWPCSWSPDGRWLAGYLLNPGAGIWIYSIDSRELLTLTDFGSYPVWLSDSRRLLFEEAGELYIVDRMSKEPRVLFSHSQGWLHPTLSKDNRTIYLTLSSLEADIWLLTPN